MAYIATLLDFLFGCHHSNLTRVFTIGGRSYQVCCDCGTEFKYSLGTMSIQHCDASTRRGTTSIIGTTLVEKV
jgi:hypothetical protein